MESAVVPAKFFRFGLFEADVSRNTLTRNGVRVKIQDQPFRVLLLLLERTGDIVTREELRLKLWPEGTFVDFDGSLNVILKKLRAAIDDDSDNPRFVETVPRRGYRFIAPVTVSGAPQQPASNQAPGGGQVASAVQQSIGPREPSPRAEGVSVKPLDWWQNPILIYALSTLVLLAAIGYKFGWRLFNSSRVNVFRARPAR